MIAGWSGAAISNFEVLVCASEPYHRILSVVIVVTMCEYRYFSESLTYPGH